MRVNGFVDAVKIQNINTIVLVAEHLLNELAICLWLHSRPIILDAGRRRGVTQRIVRGSSCSVANAIS